MYFSFLIYLCTSDRSFDTLKSKLARVIHGAIILLAEILGGFCYYEMKLLHCIFNRVNRTYNSNVLIWNRRPKVKCSSYQVFQLLGVPAVDIIFYSFKRSEALESANITNLALSILLSLKRSYKYLQIVELENCWTYNFLMFYIQFLLNSVCPYVLNSQRF